MINLKPFLSAGSVALAVAKEYLAFSNSMKRFSKEETSIRLVKEAKAFTPSTAILVAP